MSNNNGGWKPKKPEPYTCADGTEVWVQRPGPEFTIRAGRIAKTYTRFLNAKEDDEENALAAMSDQEQEVLVNYARELLCAMLVTPKLKLDPKDGELHPDDTGVDFWPLFHYGMGALFKSKVPVGDTEVEVKDLETFRTESGISGDGVDGVHVPSPVERVDGDQGMVDSAGA